MDFEIDLFFSLENWSDNDRFFKAYLMCTLIINAVFTVQLLGDIGKFSGITKVG